AHTHLTLSTGSEYGPCPMGFNAQKRLLSLLRVGRGEGRATGRADGVQLHDLGARAVRIEQVELPLGIAADLGSIRLTCEPALVPQQRVGGLSILHTQGKMIEHSEIGAAHRSSDATAIRCP